MKKILFVVLLAALALSACGQAAAEVADVEAHEYWARSGMMGGNGAVYMQLHNHTATDDALVGASSDVAEAVEVHLSQMNNGVMEMIPQEKIDLPADGEIELKPGSYHIMLIGLKQDLKAGDKISVTLHFQNHADITLEVPVEDAANMGGSGMDGDMGGMNMDATPTP